MRSPLVVAIALACAVVAGFVSSAVASTPDRRIALVIGNARYIDTPLRITVSCDGTSYSFSYVKNSIALLVTGRFVVDSSHVVAETTFRSNEGKTGTATWRRQM